MIYSPAKDTEEKIPRIYFIFNGRMFILNNTFVKWQWAQWVVLCLVRHILPVVIVMDFTSRTAVIFSLEF